MFTLKQVMKANALSCLIFGVIFLAIPTMVIDTLTSNQNIPTLAIQVLGGILVANGLHLLWAGFQNKPNKHLVLYFSFGDFVWVLGSVALILLENWINTEKGIVLTLSVAVMVGTFGLLQLLKVKQLEMNNLS